MKPVISTISAREILDSRGNPTVEATVTLENGVRATASVPSGASTGEHEAHELRDNDKRRFHGRGVLKAVKNIEKKIAPAVRGMDVTKQEDIDRVMIELDGTDDKYKLGANAILAVSLACARTGSVVTGEPLYRYLAKTFSFTMPKRAGLPVPCFNIFNGGKHADTNLDFQEFMVIPRSKNGLRTSVADMVRMGTEIFHELGFVLKEAGFDTDVGNEGGYAPDIYSSVQAIEFILAATTRAGYDVGTDMGIGIDVGASELYDIRTKKYVFQLDHAAFASLTLVELYREWLKKFHVISIEDGLAEDDWDGWRDLTERIGDEVMLVGDDLFVTNTKRLQTGIEQKVANTVLIKPNQVGTLSETVACVQLAQKNGYNIFASHRSGETTDDFIADFAVAIGADYVKFGSLSRGERVVKYNRLMAIEEELRSKRK